MKLEQILEKLTAITEGLFYDEIEFSYDAMGFTMSFSHPAELLGDMCAELSTMIEYDTADPEELSLILSGLKEMRFSFDLVVLNESIEMLENYISEIK